MAKYTIVGRAITVLREVKEKNYTKKQRRLRAIALQGGKGEIDNVIAP